MLNKPAIVSDISFVGGIKPPQQFNLVGNWTPVQLLESGRFFVSQPSIFLMGQSLQSNTNIFFN